MFYALYKKTNRPVPVNKVYDLNETFYCLNPECHAEFYIRSVDGHTSKHFCRKKSTPHISNCFYDKLNCNYKNGDTLVKSNLLDIYNGTKSTNSSPKNSRNNLVSSNSEVTYIRTPKSLLQYCLFNDIYTIYQNEIKICDIIVDCRTLFYNNYFKGFNGMKFVLGNTIRYDKNSNSIIFVVKRTTKTGKIIKLTATVKLSETIFYDVINHILNTNSKFSANQIAVFGNWKIVSKYNIECTISNKRNIIYKF